MPGLRAYPAIEEAERDAQELRNDLYRQACRLDSDDPLRDALEALAEGDTEGADRLLDWMFYGLDPEYRPAGEHRL